MLTPDEFRLARIEQSWNLMKAIRLATLFTGRADARAHASPFSSPTASHTPLMLDRGRGEKGTLIGHLARRNPQVEAIAAADSVLAVFLGPNAYISPRWYGTKPRVPTWSYVAVHAECRATMVRDRERLRAMVLDLAGLMEPLDSDWTPDSAYVDSLVGDIVGFELEILRLDSQVRLSQQNGMDDRRRVHAALSAGGFGDRQVARLMEEWSLPRDHPA
jgi:transcriptional regulator